MSATSKFLMQISRPHRPPARQCRVCGCTDDDACVTDVGMADSGRPPNDPAAHTARAVDRGHCYWIGEPGDICSRCHSAHRPTMRQVHEVERIQARVGPVTILYTNLRHQLEVLVDDRPHIVLLWP
jgi:hypothetical protein